MPAETKEPLNIGDKVKINLEGSEIHNAEGIITFIHKTGDVIIKLTKPTAIREKYNIILESPKNVRLIA